MITLHLPIPPSRNMAEGRTARATHFKKRGYQECCWLEAIQQERPSLNPPKRVIVSAHFQLYGPLRDEDGLDLKWVLDALRQAQSGKLDWRRGLYDLCGFFLDDDPAHLTLEKPTQEIDRKNRKLVLTITEV